MGGEDDDPPAGGKIINISSVSGVSGKRRTGQLQCFQGGADRNDKVDCQGSGFQGITVNAVAPGFIETDMTEVLSEKVKRRGKGSDSAEGLWQTGGCGRCGCISGIG